MRAGLPRRYVCSAVGYEDGGVIEWPESTSRGTALLKLLHQREEEPLVRDAYVGWFLDGVDMNAARSSQFPRTPSGDPLAEFERVAYWYVALRERFFDELILGSIASGTKQLLLLGSGFDTRFLRMEALSRAGTRVIEVDLPATIETKRSILRAKLSRLPSALHLVAIDLSREPLEALLTRGLDPRVPTTCIWQGVSYYLTREKVRAVLDFVVRSLPGGSVLGFDCCTPLMLGGGSGVPGGRTNIDRLAKIGESYLFAMEMEAMGRWLAELGYTNIRIIEQRRLAMMYLRDLELPGEMWYVVTARSASRR